MAKGLRERLVGLVTGATPAHAGPTIAVAHLSLRRGASEVLRDVSFTMERTGVLVILGPNGAGKTSLLETLAGLRRDHTGSVELFGEPWRARDHRRRLGVVLQREGIPDLVTVSEYASLFAALYDVPGRARWIVAQAALEARRDVAVEKLSGGEAQRLFLAAATVHDPSLVLLDEPAAHLDPFARRALGERVRAMAETRAVVLSTHDLAEADAVADRALFLVGGEVRREGTRAALLEAVPPEARRTGGLADAFFHFCGATLSDAGELS